MQRIRPAIDRLEQELGLEHVLASQSLYSDGAEVLYNFSKSKEDTAVMELVVVRNGQHVFNEVVQRYLKRIEFARTGTPN